MRDKLWEGELFEIYLNQIKKESYSHPHNLYYETRIIVVESTKHKKYIQASEIP